MTYFNTTNLTGQELKQAWITAESQEKKALVLFLKYPTEYFTPFDVLDKVFSSIVPITSIRRALTNLTDDGYLVKTTTQKTGPYGKLCHCWRLKTQ